MYVVTVCRCVVVRTLKAIKKSVDGGAGDDDDECEEVQCMSNEEDSRGSIL